MIEELKMILEAIGDVSGFAIWALAGFLLYKIVIYLATAGTIVFLCELLIERIYSWAVSPKPPAPPVLKNVGGRIERMCITDEDTADRQIALLRRVAGKGIGIGTNYIHGASADWLEEAINEKESRDNATSA